MEGFAVVAVNQRENAALVNKFMKTHGLNFATPLDTDGRVAASYRVYGIPVTYLIDGNGQAIGMKSIEEAVAVRDRLIDNFHRAALLPAGPERDRLLTVVVVGGGFAGIETFAELPCTQVSMTA